MRSFRLLFVATLAFVAATPGAFAQNAGKSGPSLQPAALSFHATPVMLPNAADRSTPAPAPAPVPRSGFASSGFAQFMSSPAGRILRVAAGAGMIAGGINADSDGGTIVAVAGGVPLLAGTFDFCVISPLFGGPFWGKNIRAAKGK
jgi:hypothetical protein